MRRCRKAEGKAEGEAALAPTAVTYRCHARAKSRVLGRHHAHSARK
jgi:hypothetical protein